MASEVAEKLHCGGIFDPAAEAAVVTIGLLRRDWKSRPFKAAADRVFSATSSATPQNSHKKQQRHEPPFQLQSPNLNPFYSCSTAVAAFAASSAASSTGPEFLPPPLPPESTLPETIPPPASRTPPCWAAHSH